jgi:hypothetical protein
LKARRTSAPNFTVWLPITFVRFATTWYCFSCSESGQLQRPASRPEPNLICAVPPFSSKKGSPELKVSSRFRPGMPAAAAGDVPKSFGSTSTPYLKKPKRTSRIVVGLSVKSAPAATLWFLTCETPPRLTSSWPPPCPKAWGPLMSNFW